MPSEDCPRCEGTGFIVSEEESVAQRCGCGRTAPSTADLAHMGMPRRYLHCSLDSYHPVTPNQRQAVAVARSFVDEYPAVDRGIMFTGPCGTGKTHLAAAILRQLVLDQGIRAVFADYQDLLKRIQATYSRGAPGDVTEDRVLGPVLEAELLVLDDFGSRRTTPWAEETVSHVLNVRYNEERVTVLTTNLLNIEAEREHVPGDNVLLSERVSERVLSRLHEMCRVVDIVGPDHRRSA